MGEAAIETELSIPFEMQATPVTQKQWELVMGTNPSHFKGDPNLPIEQVSWNDAQEFIKKLNILDPNYNYRLSTDAEWEYAVRAGTDTVYHFGNSEKELEEHAWVSTNSGNQTHPVARKKPNQFGLFDMYGNVWEWIHDWYDSALKGGKDPRGPSAGSNRVMRGGSWNNNAQNARSADRNIFGPGNRSHGVGFRLVRTKK